MKNLLKIIFLICLLTISKISVEQPSFNPLTDCNMPSILTEGSSSAVVGGLYKPHRTDLSGGIPSLPDARLNVLIVFVQFANESIGSSEWPIDSMPTYIDSIIAETKESSGDYWNRYVQSTELLSDWFQEVSRGRMHITGKTYNIILDDCDSCYSQTTNGMTIMNNEIYQKLEGLGTIDWNEFDLWRQDSDDLFYYEPDKKIDMIIKVHRHRGNTGSFFDGAGGYAYLDGDEYRIIQGIDTFLVDPNSGRHGSGLTIFGTAKGPVGKSFWYNVVRHEYGHYLFGGGHNYYGIMGAGDIYLSPYEILKLGYQTPQTVDYNYKDYSLLDYSSRTTSGEILIVPINMPNEFFIITNRRKVSNYDVLMFGDTCKEDFLKDVGDYGKGVYIDHIFGGLAYTSPWDIECADGLWNWIYKGQTTPDWSPSQNINVYEKTNISGEVLNDAVGGYNNRDGRSFGIGGFEGWFSRGKRHLSTGGIGVDRIFTNDTNFWTSRARDGDRWDPWNIGYNNIFSPYSNPNTKNWNNDNTGIFIYYESLSSGTSNLKIFRTDSGGYTETQILAQTPPSKPMGIVVDYHLEGENYMRPKVSWNHNQEPDMIRNDDTKRYKIWRATQSSMAYVPTNYTLIKTLDVNSEDDPSYIDTSIIALGSAWPGMGPQIKYPVRYKVQAVDTYGDSSVRSDFGSAIGLLNCSLCSEERIHLGSGEIPDSYKLFDNYPNPFNPETKIKFDLPEDNFVTIKVYDILGKEILTLLNELKNAGRYNISFNGSNFASGIYYYKIKAGNFEAVKKMILLK